jgi:hypothetical protein
MTTDLATIVALFRKGLWLPDVSIVYVVLATVAANRLLGDPTWLLVIAPPSSGKSEVLHALGKLSEHHPVSSMTEAGLLSGTVSRDGTGTGGLLRQLGDRGLIVASDFGTALSEHGDSRGRTFAALREIFDGSYTRRLGTSGGLTVAWEGHAGFVGAVTEAVDSPDVSMGVLGERFCYYRTPPATVEDDLRACSLAAELSGQEDQLRVERAEAVAQFFAGLALPDELPPLTDSEYERLSTLATVGARLRSPTVRDGRTREVVVVPQPERPMRLLRQLRHLHAGLVVIGCPEHETWRLLGQVALGGTHPGRRAIVDCLLGEPQGHTTATVAARCRVPKTSAGRHLEDLTAHGVLDLIGDMPQVWMASAWLRAAWWAVSSAGGQTTSQLRDSEEAF